MERALNRERLALALGGRTRLPSAEELQRLLAQAEVDLFVQQPRVPDNALATGWYLHAVASSPSAFDVYTPARQRRAFQVSAHILDLAMQDRGRSRIDRCRLAFGAAVGYRRGELEPNAMAVFRRARAILGTVDEEFLDRLPFVSFEVGLTLLGFETRAVADLTTTLRRQFVELRRQVGLDDLSPTIFGPLEQIVEAADRIRQFLFRGDAQRLADAQDLLRAAASQQDGPGDLDQRWVAAHLLALIDDVAGSSVWTALPPSVPPAVKQALVLSDPPVVTLWKPQLDLFRSGDPDVLASETRRIVMSLPTSAGKTLVAQMLALTHLANGVDSVCYVAPMRSLGREVREALRGRLRVIRRELGSDLPDFLAGFLAPGDIPDPQVDVMTPERLGFLMRNDLEGVLDRYGLFIFDEAHLIADPSRGFELEWILTMLHWRTRETSHRIVLLSAALGNRAQLKAWVDPDDIGKLYASEWRGPRRLHAVFYTDAQWQRPEHVPFGSRGWPQRVLFPLEGRVQLRPADGLNPREVRLNESVGTLAFRVNDAGVREGSRHESSTPQYLMNAQIAVAVGAAGPVLIVVSTRLMTRQMARAIGSHLTESRETRELTDFVTARLGNEHPLVPLLPFRVAYHHAGLPTDVLEALEEALRQERLLYLTATTTLTEGVNLPVKSVVLAETRYPGQDPGAQILGARLINAMGRAGRATKETEGWAIICKPGTPGPEDFARMRPADTDLTVRSRLATREALEAAALFEETAAGAADAVFAHHADAVNNFLAFVWLVLTSIDELNRAATAADVDEALSATLAFAQLPPDDQERWRRLGRLVHEAFEASDPLARRRWAKSGTSLGSARSLDQIAAAVTDAARAALTLDRPIEQPEVALQVLDQADAFSGLLALAESPREWGFRPTPNAPRSINVPLRGFLQRWIAGADVGTLATEFLSVVGSRELAVEQIVDAVSELCEHFLSWTLGVVVATVNTYLAEDDPGVVVAGRTFRGVIAGPRLCENLAMYVRYGVDSAEAVELISSGLRSREFAHRVAAVACGREEEGEGLRDWLQGLPMDRWRRTFDGTPSDFLDLLEFTRTRGRGLLGALLADERAEVETNLGDAIADGSVAVRLIETDRPPRRFGVFRGPEMLGVVSPGAHADMTAVVDSGLEFDSDIIERTLILSLPVAAAGA
jgi:hypothetical protein